ncbi:MAG: hypothetical protein E7029_01875 [Planctomycetaceae bacterium]|nr:hypothetical protein [Planctomycetaceae bacterium]
MKKSAFYVLKNVDRMAQNCRFLSGDGGRRLFFSLFLSFCFFAGVNAQNVADPPSVSDFPAISGSLTVSDPSNGPGIQELEWAQCFFQVAVAELKKEEESKAADLEDLFLGEFSDLFQLSSEDLERFLFRIDSAEYRKEFLLEGFVRAFGEQNFARAEVFLELLEKTEKKKTLELSWFWGGSIDGGDAEAEAMRFMLDLMKNFTYIRVGKPEKARNFMKREWKRIARLLNGSGENTMDDGEVPEDAFFLLYLMAEELGEEELHLEMRKFLYANAGTKKQLFQIEVAAKCRSLEELEAFTREFFREEIQAELEDVMEDLFVEEVDGFEEKFLADLMKKSYSGLYETALIRFFRSAVEADDAEEREKLMDRFPFLRAEWERLLALDALDDGKPEEALLLLMKNWGNVQFESMRFQREVFSLAVRELIDSGKTEEAALWIEKFRAMRGAEDHRLAQYEERSALAVCASLWRELAVRLYRDGNPEDAEKYLRLVRGLDPKELAQNAPNFLDLQMVENWETLARIGRSEEAWREIAELEKIAQETAKRFESTDALGTPHLNMELDSCTLEYLRRKASDRIRFVENELPKLRELARAGKLSKWGCHELIQEIAEREGADSAIRCAREIWKGDTRTRQFLALAAAFREKAAEKQELRAVFPGRSADPWSRIF